MFSIEAIPHFHVLPLQVRLGLLFLFCFSLASLNDFPPSGGNAGFHLPGFRLCPRIRSQLPRTAPTGPVWGFDGAVPPTQPSKPHTVSHRAEFGFSPQNELTPPPLGGGAGYHLS